MRSAVATCAPLLALSAATAVADSDDIGRLRYDHQHRLNDRSRIFSTISYEGQLSGYSPGTQEQASLRGGLTYNAKPWLRLEAAGGLYYSWRDPAHDLFEFRLWQAATFDWPEVHGIKHWVVHHRFSLEERFRKSGDWSNSLRGRYRLAFTLPVNRRTVEPGALYLPLEGEVFVDGDKGSELFADRFQATAGLGYQFNKAWSGELRYIWQESRGTLSESFTRDEDVIELRIKSTVRIVDYLKSR